MLTFCYRDAWHGMADGITAGIYRRRKDQALLQKTGGQAESSYLFAMTIMGTHDYRIALALLWMVLPWLSDQIIFHYSGSLKFASSYLNLRDQSFIQNSYIINSFQNCSLNQNSLQICEILVTIPKTCIAKMRGNILKFIWKFTELQIIKSI